MSRIRFPAVLVLLFLLPRLAFLAYLTTFPPSLAYLDLEPNLVNGAIDDGRWITWAKDLDVGKLTEFWEDLGAPYFLLGLNKIGFSYIWAFRLLGLVLTLFGAWLIHRLYHALSRRMDPTIAFVGLATVALYPRFIYFSTYFFSFVFAPLAFGLAMLILLESDRLLGGGRRQWPYLIGAAAVLVSLYVCRRTVNAVMGALVVALILQGAFKPGSRKNLLVFVGSLCVFLAGTYLFLPRASHLLWHHIYRGFTNFGNERNINPADTAMIELGVSGVPGLAPEKAWTDARYEDFYKRKVIETVRENPGWYARLLVKRFARLAILPRSGGWLPRLNDARLNRPVRLYDLVRGGGALCDRLYVVVYSLTMGIDAFLVLLGFVAGIAAVTAIGLRAALPFLVLLASVLYVFTFVDAQYHDVYLGGTLMYVFLAGVLCASALKYSMSISVNRATPVTLWRRALSMKQP